MSDSELCEGLRVGDPTAIGEVYERYSKRLLAYATTRTNAALAQDIVQDVFARFLDRDRPVPHIRRLEAFLFSLTADMVVEWQRKESRQTRYKKRATAILTRLVSTRPSGRS